ncbi:hypothetical protein ANO11243_030080 [Dothideomycetidae sp. 11243]|nr:hypothetical protein ANO11243_030080 [fungal sp. No.11243]
MSSILYRHESNNVFVVDIPASIAEAQAFADKQLKLISSVAIHQPWPSNEPKSDKARAKLKAQQPDDQPAQEAIKNALTSVKDGFDAIYCFPRIVSPESVPIGQKRRRSESESQLSVNLAGPGSQPTHAAKNVGDTLNSRPYIVLAAMNTDIESLDEVDERLVCNSTLSTVKLTSRGTSTTYTIPSQASFHIGDCSDPRYFRQGVKKQAEDNQTCRRFDVVVMDPPWPSSSIRRGKQLGKSHYTVLRSVDDMRRLLFGMDLGTLVDGGGLLAVWITNKPAIRSLVASSSNSLFSQCGLQLMEEWIWVKVTSNGEPVLPVDSLWRKPYEILLVGKKVTAEEETRSPDPQRHEVRRRVILAVPDLHSRKPCLKQLMTDVFQLPPRHRGLEIFARNLVSGWHAWGNEALKFNDEACWARGVVRADFQG